MAERPAGSVDSVGSTLRKTYLEAFASATPWYCGDIVGPSSSPSPPAPAPRCRRLRMRSKNSAFSCRTQRRGRGSLRRQRRFFFLLSWDLSPAGSPPASAPVSRLDSLYAVDSSSSLSSLGIRRSRMHGGNRSTSQQTKDSKDRRLISV